MRVAGGLGMPAARIRRDRQAGVQEGRVNEERFGGASDSSIRTGESMFKSIVCLIL